MIPLQKQLGAQTLVISRNVTNRRTRIQHSQETSNKAVKAMGRRSKLLRQWTENPTWTKTKGGIQQYLYPRDPK